MLVRAFEVEVGREARVVAVRAAQHRVVRRARVEPDVERVAAFLVVRCFGAQQLLGASPPARPRCRPAPRASPPPPAARACADAARRSRGAGRTASARPTAAGATASSPDGWRSCRAAAPGPRRGRTRCSRCRAAPSARKDLALPTFLSIDGEPLHGGAQDHRRLVAPAVHVAVLVDLVVQQRAARLQLLDDLRVRVPDRQPAEQRQRRREPPVAHHRREDLRRPSCRSAGRTRSPPRRRPAPNARCRCRCRA